MLYIHNYFTTNITFTVSSNKDYVTAAGGAPKVYRCSTANREGKLERPVVMMILNSVENNLSNVTKILAGTISSI